MAADTNFIFLPQTTTSLDLRCATPEPSVLNATNVIAFAVTADYLQFKMSYVAKGEKEYDAAGAVPPAKLHKIRITLTSSKVPSLEKCTWPPFYVLRLS